MSAYGALSDDAVGGKPLVVALAACHQGQTKAGVDSGWIALAGDVNLSGATFVDFRDQRKFGNPIKGAMILSRNIGCALDKAAKAANADDVPLLCLGGDHTVSVGTVAATKWRHPTTRLIWIDAHPDINTPDTTMSGNCHGMPVAHLMNLVDGFQLPACIEPHEILYIGLRSIDDAELVRLEAIRQAGGFVYYADEILERGMDAILADVDSKWGSPSATAFDFPLHISLDVDSMDPKFAPATGTPVPDGLTPQQVATVLQWANSRAYRGLCHLDIVELNPDLSTARGAATTIATTQVLLSAWIQSHARLRP
ncbi:Arginase [Plasmodiophora brassicae]|uniref:Arginase n=1 Tax=Plasmodiophora brassicae TaxID=37360 RepID=A0A3P3Y4C0_PLABS|nr:unnamed protein product [Plasmodiophora brassicae]